MGKATHKIFFITLVGVFGLVSPPAVRAQEGDPSDIWLRAWMVMREGEEKEQDKKDLEALSKYRESQRLFDFLARTYPQWKANMITFRRKALLDKIEEVYGRLKGTDPNAEQKYRAQNPGVASAPNTGARPGITIPSNPEAAPAPPPLAVPLPSAPVPSPGIAAAPVAPVESMGQEFKKYQDQLDLMTGANQRMKVELDQRQQAVATLERQLQQSSQVEQQLRTQLTQALDKLKTAETSDGEQKRKLEEQLQLATTELRNANTQSAGILKALEAAKAQVEELTKQKSALLASREGEAEKMAQLSAQLEQATGDRDKARTDRDAAREELKRLKEGTTAPKQEGAEGAAPMNADLAARLKESERQNQELIAKLEAQVKGDPALKGNEELVAELKKSGETITSLNAKVKELEQEKAGLQRTNQQLLARQDQLIKERDLLRKERDEMAILLRAGNQVKGDVKDILAANGAWRQQLEEANKRTYALQEKEGNYQREIEQLRGQLTSMQTERDTLRAENTRYQQTVSELSGKLQKMLAELDQKTKALEEFAAGRGGDGKVIVAGKVYTKEELEGMVGAQEEVELVRGIIRDQLVQQTKAHKARQLVLQELENMDYQSELLLTSLDDMVGKQINISEEVKKMFRGRDEMQLIEVAESAQASEKKFSSLKTGPEAAQAKKKRITQLAKAANFDFIQGAYAKAKDGYDQILSIQPNDVFALANMGLIHAQMGDPAKAKEFLQRALNHDSTHAQTYYYLGLVYFKQGEYGPAMDAFGKCLTNDRNNANAHFYLGLIAKEKGRVARAESEFLDAVKLDPKNANAHFNLAVLYANEKQDKALASKHYKRARELGAGADSAMDAFLHSQESVAKGPGA